MAGYKSYIVEPTEMDGLLEEVNKENLEIVEMVYLSDSQQILCVCKEPKPGFLATMKAKAKSEEVKEE